MRGVQPPLLFVPTEREALSPEIGAVVRLPREYRILPLKSTVNTAWMGHSSLDRLTSLDGGVLLLATN